MEKKEEMIKVEEKKELSVEKIEENKLMQIVSDANGLFFQMLDLSGSQISCLDLYTKFSLIQNLDIHDNQIRSLKPLKELRNLVVLNASNNNLEHIIDFVPSNGVSSLKFCNFSGNSIRTLLNLKFFKNIKKLNLSNNKLSNVDNIKFLLNIKELDLSNNQIEDIMSFNELCIEKLDLGFNQIDNVVNINPVFLQILRLNNNCVKELGEFTKFKNLIELDVSVNEISSVHYVKFLKDLGFLRKLDINKNNFSTDYETSIKHILYFVPQISVLNKNKVSSKEKVLSSNYFGEDKKKI